MSDEVKTDEEWWDSMMEAERWESEFAEGFASERKYQLYAVAWCRHIWDLFPYDCCRQIVETLERLADGLCDKSDLKAAGDLIDSLPGTDLHAGLSEAQSHALSAAITCVMDKENRLATTAESYCQGAIKANKGGTVSRENMPNSGEASYDLIREVICNPSRPVSVDPAWLTQTVVALAHTAYDKRIMPSGILENARLAVLADALEEAGCTNIDILTHLRQSGDHVRGCWGVDLLLGR